MSGTRTAAEKISAARTNLLLKHPFFGTIAMFLRVKEDKTLYPPTMAVDGVTLFYHPDFVMSLSDEHVRGVVVHELWHVIMKHHLRRKSRTALRWNYAADYAINQEVLNLGFRLPEGCLFNESYRGQSAEMIYEQLKPEGGGGQGQGPQGNPGPGQSGQNQGQGGQNQGQPGQNQGQSGQEEDGGGYDPAMVGGVLPHPSLKEAPDGSVSGATAEIEMQLDSTIIMAATAAKKAGKLPAGVEIMIKELLEPKADWETTLARFVDSFAKNDFSYRRLNRSMMQRGLIGPGLLSEDIGNALIVLDLSGSIGKKERIEELSEVFGILDRYDVNLTLASADTKIYMVGQWEKGDIPDPESIVLQGGGGTSLDALVPWVEQHDLRPRFCIYLTDAYLSDWGEEPEFPLLVGILPGGTNRHVPEWAEVVNLF